LGFLWLKLNLIDTESFPDVEDMNIATFFLWLENMNILRIHPSYGQIAFQTALCTSNKKRKVRF
jgi:hypothetical protein